MPDRHLPEILVVGTVRNVYDWLMAMRRVCYCCEDLQKLPLPDFLRKPFTNTRFSYASCPWAADVVFHEANRPFRNIIEARKLKMQNLLNLRTSRRIGGVELFRLVRGSAAAAAASPPSTPDGCAPARVLR